MIVRGVGSSFFCQLFNLFLVSGLTTYTGLATDGKPYATLALSLITIAEGAGVFLCGYILPAMAKLLGGGSGANLTVGSIALIIIGIIFYGQGTGQTMINIGIFAFSLAVLFQIVTLPVEFNASNRAIRVLESTGIFGTSELKCTKKVLGAAALTYVAAAASSILQLLRLILLFGGRDDD